MQFPNPIARYLIISDNSGNTVIAIGPGPSIVIKGDGVTSGDIEMTQSGGQSIIRFWNVAHNDFAEVYSTDDPAGHPQLQLLSGARTSLIPPGTPLVRTSVRLDFDGVHVGPVDAGGVNIGGFIEAFDLGTDMQAIDSNGTGIVSMALEPDYTTFLHGISFNCPPYGNAIRYEGKNNYISQSGSSGATGQWTVLPLASGWTAKAGYRTPAYRRDLNNNMQFRGTMTGGVTADNTQIATIPAALAAPANVVMRPAVAPTGAGNAGSSRLFQNGPATGLFCYGMAGVTDIALDGLSYNLDT